MKIHEVLIGSDLSVKKKHLPTDPFFKASSSSSSSCIHIISGPSSSYQNIISSLVYYYIHQNDKRKAFSGKKRWEGKNVLVWHHPSQDPFVDLYRFLSMQSCDFSIWSLGCTIVDNLIHCLGSKQKILTTRMKKNWNSVSVTFKLDIFLKSKYRKVWEPKL